MKEGRSKQKLENLPRESSRKKKGSSMIYYYISFGVLGAIILYVVVMLFLNQSPPLHKVPTIDDKRIEEHNQNFPWRQGPNKFFEGTTLADAKKIINTSFSSHPNLVRCQTDDSIVPPDSFDFRHNWPNCALPVGNQQKTCGSSYALALAQTTAERLCINSKSQKLTNLSSQEVLSCDVSNQGCKGGQLNLALDYIRHHGLIEETCLPYQAETEIFKPNCDKPCENPIRHKIESYCLLYGEEDIKREIYKNGPVVSTMHVYADILTYKGGIYQKGDDVPRFSQFQTIKIVGWGIESGTDLEPNKGNKYWIIQNSWGDDWGNDGYAKISLGQELFFDQYAYAIKVRSELETAKPKSTTKQETKDEKKTKAEEEEEDKYAGYTDTSKTQENKDEETKLD